ncbi:hypothetical protein EYF80_043717 [Liparis tanakae]|uniref:Uncharacterized protein n=1 Tax=Liparis tanakae TaxID=230148 RepID=A0A4Z2FXZ5_9TELE|nr:hypothetical protein EYF80_043717 [Liparis tanakae]
MWRPLWPPSELPGVTRGGLCADKDHPRIKTTVRIRIRVKTRVRIRVRIRVKTRVRIRVKTRKLPRYEESPGPETSALVLVHTADENPST